MRNLQVGKLIISLWLGELLWLLLFSMLFLPMLCRQRSSLCLSVIALIGKSEILYGVLRRGRGKSITSIGRLCANRKGMGGLGLRNARDLNKAFLMKIVWGLLNNPSDLWAKVLIAKYLKKTPEDIALQVIGMTPPRNNIGHDSFTWGLEPNGKFTVSSAYQLLNELSPDLRDPIWNGIWRLPGPNRIKHFLWMATHKRLLTNEERS
ncbi:hypothetical protein LINPERHAP2_LOCUS26073 [Linum perenne]